MAARFINFVVSGNGQKLITVSLVTFGFGSFLYNAVPNTVFLNKYQELYQLYNDGLPVSLPESIQYTFEDVVTDLKNQLPARAKVKPFMTSEFDIFNAGTTCTHQGAVIGIPATFTYNSLEDVNKKNILVGSRSVKWEMEAGERLKESLVLSDKAKKFAVAHEILMTNTYHLYLKCVYPPTLVFLSIKLSEFCRYKLNLRSQPPIFRGMVYSFITVFGCVIWCVLNDKTNIKYELKTTKALAELSDEYIQGGVEYYTKTLERNKAIRDLLPEGPSKYTVTGNKHTLFRFPTIPLTVRKQILEDWPNSKNIQI